MMQTLYLLYRKSLISTVSPNHVFLNRFSQHENEFSSWI